MTNNIINFQRKVQSNDDIGFFLETALGKKKDQGTANMMVAINNSDKLALCEPMSVAAAIIQPTMLNLSLSTGEAYIIPFGNKATMQISYKGLLTLAIRTNSFVRINSSDVREGELIGKDRLTGEFKFKWIEDEAKRLNSKIVGYLAHMELTNGFVKTIFWTQEKLHKHFIKFSKYNYDAVNREWKSKLLSLEEKSKITLLKKLITTWAPKSSEIIQAIQSDGSTFNQEGVKVVADNIKKEEERKPATKEVISEIFKQIHIALITEGKTAKEAKEEIKKYLISPEVDIKLEEIGGVYGMTKDELKLIAIKAEKELKIEISVYGSRISQEVNENEKDKEITI